MSDIKTLFLFIDSTKLGGAEIVMKRWGDFLSHRFENLVWYLGAPELYEDVPGEKIKLEAIKRTDVGAIMKLVRRLKSTPNSTAVLNMPTPTALQPAIAACRLAGIPRVCLHHSPYHINTSAFQLWLARRQLKTVPAHITVGDRGKDQLHEAYGVPFADITAWYPGVDCGRFTEKGTNFRNSEGLGNGPIIGQVGRLESGKGPATLITATAMLLKHHPNLQLVFVGDGPDKNALSRTAKELGIQNAVRFVSFTDKIESWYRTFDIMCLPSKFECVPLTVLESMATALPIVVTDVGSLSYVLDKTGVSFTEDSPEAFAKRIHEILADPEKSRETGQLLRERVMQCYEQKNQFIELMDLCDRLFEQQRPRR